MLTAGKNVRISGWIKTGHDQHAAYIMLALIEREGSRMPFVSAATEQIKRTNPWKRDEARITKRGYVGSRWDQFRGFRDS